MANKRPETGTLNITVRGGVNVEDQRYSNTKGDYFKGFMAGDKTVLVSDGARRYWTIVMDDVQTGERYTFTFSYEMLIGRTPPHILRHLLGCLEELVICPSECIRNQI